jgi:mRNA-degrading endonuclease YafQ of YafQ-DinJ toxin-antitoxin module
MENQLLMTMKSESISKVAPNKLEGSQAIEFATAFKELFLSKNLQAMDGTLQVWEKCMLEDMEKLDIKLEHFIKAMSENIRKKAYGRLDYFDLHISAIKFSIVDEKEYISNTYSEGNFRNLSLPRIRCHICEKPVTEMFMDRVESEYQLSKIREYIESLTKEEITKVKNCEHDLISIWLDYRDKEIKYRLKREILLQNEEKPLIKNNQYL